MLLIDLLNFSHYKIRIQKYQVKFGYIEEGKVFRRGFMDFPDREVGVVKETEEETLQYFTERFESIAQQVEEVKSKIQDQANKGSFLVKVTNLKKSLSEADALGDFEALYNVLESLEKELSEYIAQNRHKNLQIKTALLEELKIAAASHEWKSATLAIKEIQQKWMKTGAVEAELKGKIEDDFKTLTGEFFEKRASFYADLDKMLVEKEAEYEKFLKSAQTTLDKAESGRLRSVQNQLKEEWKTLGKIKPSRHQEFWNDFQKILKTASKKVKAKSNASPKENETRKLKVLSQLKEINNDVAPKADIRPLMNEWKSIGFASKELNGQLNQEFHELTSLISEKKFLNELLNKKARKGVSDKDKESLRIKLLYDLLHRDVNELNVFEENIEKFNTSKGLDTMLEKKLTQQRRKVEVKKNLLAELKRGNQTQ